MFTSYYLDFTGYIIFPVARFLSKPGKLYASAFYPGAAVGS
jgi:hypothetical protein